VRVGIGPWISRAAAILGRRAIPRPGPRARAAGRRRV